MSEKTEEQIKQEAIIIMTERIKIADWIRQLPKTQSLEWIADKLEFGEIGFI